MLIIMGLSFLNFNPRTREGCDALGQTDAANYIKISIHAPVKGATQQMTEHM